MIWCKFAAYILVFFNLNFVYYINFSQQSFCHQCTKVIKQKPSVSLWNYIRKLCIAVTLYVLLQRKQERKKCLKCLLPCSKTSSLQSNLHFSWEACAVSGGKWAPADQSSTKLQPWSSWPSRQGPSRPNWCPQASGARWGTACFSWSNCTWFQSSNGSVSWSSPWAVGFPTRSDLQHCCHDHQDGRCLLQTLRTRRECEVLDASRSVECPSNHISTERKHCTVGFCDLIVLRSGFTVPTLNCDDF